MKLMAAFLVFFSIASEAYTLNLRDVVMAEDYVEHPIVREFPCSAYIDVVSCSNFVVLEKDCRNSLKFVDDTYSCVTSSGKRIKFATVNRNEKIVDETLPGTRAFRKTFSPQVSLRKFTTPNGNEEYQLIVED